MATPARVSQRIAMLEGQDDVRFPEGTYALHFLFGQPREEGLNVGDSRGGAVRG